MIDGCDYYISLKKKNARPTMFGLSDPGLSDPGLSEPCRKSCRSLVGWLVGKACRNRLSESFLNGPVGLVGVLSDALSDCLVGVFWWQEAFLKDVSYESLVGELFLEESLVGSCRTSFLA